MAINQQITALPDAPNRLDRDNFATDMHAFFVGMQAMTVELETFRGEANTTATGVNTDATAAVTARTAAQTAQTAAETAQTAAETVAGASSWGYTTSYSLNDAVSGSDGHIYKSLTNNNIGNCPHGYNRITRVGAVNHWIGETVTIADPSGKTYTLKVKMWRETLTGEISLVIEEGSGDFEIMVYDSQVVTQTIAEYSTTATFPAGSDADVRMRINPNDNDGPDGDTFGVHSVFLYDHADPDTNLLTGNSSWQTDLTGWDATNCTISTVYDSLQNWVNITQGKGGYNGIDVLTGTSGNWTCPAGITKAKVTLISVGRNAGDFNPTNLYPSTFTGPDGVVVTTGTISDSQTNADIHGSGASGERTWLTGGGGVGATSILGDFGRGADGNQEPGGAAGNHSIKVFTNLVPGNDYAWTNTFSHSGQHRRNAAVIIEY